MPVALHHIVIDAHDLPTLARFWSAALGWPILSEREREVIVGPALDAPIGLCFMPSPDEKVAKNRVHLDLNPGAGATPDERAAEVERLIALGARRVDVGQRGDETWTVLADPEGNEFCVVRPKANLVG
jgi:predicted enzyme related to lactoylglutathione lyase